jgi:hypothetical protein
VLIYLLAVLAGRRHSQTAGPERHRRRAHPEHQPARDRLRRQRDGLRVPMIWLVSVAAGSQNTTAAACSGGFGAAYIAAAAFLARRS